MKIFAVLLILIFLNSCTTVRDCAWNPKVQVKVNKPDNKDPKDTEVKEKSTLETVKEIVEPGAQVVCKY